MDQLKTKKITALSIFMFLTIVGTYNSVVINSESMLHRKDPKFVKRLDEVYGVVKPGRMVATSTQWRKVVRPSGPITEKPQFIRQEVRTLDSAPASVSESGPVASAAVQEELSLNLTEVINPKKWQQGLTAAQFSGNLSTSNGTIESLSVSLPNGEGVSLSFSEMNGNVFEYDIEGQVYSGMMYQVDQKSYMVILSNGPLEGTRMKFTNDAPLEENSQVEPQQPQVAEENFGQPEETQQLSEPNNTAVAALAEGSQDNFEPQSEQVPTDSFGPVAANEEMAMQQDELLQSQGVQEQEAPLEQNM